MKSCKTQRKLNILGLIKLEGDWTDKQMIIILMATVVLLSMLLKCLGWCVLPVLGGNSLTGGVIELLKSLKTRSP